jgi:chromosome segregation ATPase
MMDQNKFLNTYIDVILNTAHEQINSIVQLKTNLRLAEDTVKDISIHAANLEREKQELEERVNLEAQTNSNYMSNFQREKQELEETISRMNSKISSLTNDLEGYRQKASQVDTFANQIILLKKELEKYQKPIVEKKVQKKPPENKDDF